ncbi:MAG: sterol desaturase family protein [Elusimicrobiota bacterium]
MRKLLACVLSIGIAGLSVEPALGQVRAVAAESSGSSVGVPALPRLAALSLNASGGPFGLQPDTLTGPVSSAPLWSAAKASALAAAPAAAPAPLFAASVVAPAVPEAAASLAKSEARQAGDALEALARPAALDWTLASENGAVFFDQAARPSAASLTVSGAAGRSPSRLQPRAVGTRLLAFGRKWGLPITVASLAVLGPLAAGVQGAAIDPHSASFALWSNIGRGLAMAVPLVAIAGWGLFKRYRAKETEAAKARFAAAPLHKPIQPALKHFLTNMTLAAIGIAAIAVVAGPYISTFNNWVDSHSIGILHWLGVKGWANVAASMVMLDFLDYLMHYASHRFSWLWRLHKVHHTDLDYDLSTTYRMHPLETAAVMLFGLLEFVVVGPNLLAMTIGDLIAIVMGQYQHANITMPEPVENFLSKFFMTSHKHFIHHAMSPDDYDSNYGHIFSFWDRLLGTFKNHEPKYLHGIVPGIREYPNPQELTVIKLLKMPFERQAPRPPKPVEDGKP